MIAVVATPGAPPDPEELFRALCRTDAPLRGAPVPPVPRRAAEDTDPAHPEVRAEKRRRHPRYDRPRGARHLPPEGMRTRDSERDTAGLPHLPALRGDVRPRGDDRAGRRRADPRGRRGRLQPRLHLPEGREHRRPASRPGPAPAAARAPAGRLPRGGRLGRGIRRGGAPARPDPRGPRPRRDRGVRRQPDGAQPRRQPLPPRLPQDARHAIALHGRHGRPAAEVARERAALRLAVHGRDPRSRSHVAPARPRRQPRRLERQPHRRSRHAGAAAGDPRARRQGGRRRPACAREPRARRTSTTSSGPGRTRCCSRRSRTRCSTRGSSACASLEAHVSGLAEVEAFVATFPPERVARACGIEAPQIRRLGRELAARRERSGLRPDRDDAAGVRHGRELARRRAERADREPRPAGRRHVHDARPPAGRPSSASRAAARASRRGAGTAACAACPRCSASCRSPVSRRRSTPRATGGCARS